MCTTLILSRGFAYSGLKSQTYCKTPNYTYQYIPIGIVLTHLTDEKRQGIVVQLFIAIKLSIGIFKTCSTRTHSNTMSQSTILSGMSRKFCSTSTFGSYIEFILRSLGADENSGTSVFINKASYSCLSKLLTI
jgi:hypothetical protein